MNKLISLAFKTLISKFHNGEHVDFFHRLITALTALVAAVPSLGSIFNALTAIYAQEDDIFKRNQAAIQTGSLGALHDKRVGLFTYFKQSVLAVKYFGTAAQLEAMELLLYLLKNYEKLTTLSYSDQTGLLHNFLEDCEKPTYKPAIQLLGLTEQVDRILAANTEFETQYTERSTEQAESSDQGNMSEAREKTDNVFVSFVDAVNVTWTANELGAKDAGIRTSLTGVKNVVEGAINQGQLNLARRGHHKAKDDGKTDEGTQAPDTTNPPAPNTPPQQPDTTNPPAPNTPPQQPDTTIPPINPEDLNPPAAGE
ncbi:MAG: DUF6261 family protein [Tannerellaceae bacterium]|jgi:hypothetical protein|nr:DUF6261 family protein [Tannerellaceae bacterium]